MSQKIIDIALKEVGYTETPAGTNKTKYGKWFGFDGVAWCGIFCSWVYDKAGFPLGNIGFTKGFAGCGTAVDYFKKKNCIIDYKDALAGDLVFFDWNIDGRYDHVGLFKQHLGKGLFETIEGNTSLTNQSNGGQVMIRNDRKYSQAIFVRPKVFKNEKV